MTTSRIDTKKIIVEGDVTALVKTAEEIGKELARQLTTSQIRNVFGEVRRIQLKWPELVSDEIEHQDDTIKRSQRADDAFRQTVLLRPKLAYQARKERGRGVEQLKDILEPCLQEIQNAQSPKIRKLYFDRFIDFFESILAYHRAYGGN